jgi:hypothetical protein
VVDEQPPAGLRGSSKVTRRSKRPGRSSAGSRLSARFVAATSRMFDGVTCGPRELAVRRQQQVGAVDEPAAQALAGGRVVEGLQLHEQLVDDPAGALAGGEGARDRGGGVRPTAATPCRGSRRRPRREAASCRRDAAAGHRDRVDLLDEADRAALLAGGLAQRLK